MQAKQELNTEKSDFFFSPHSLLNPLSNSEARCLLLKSVNQSVIKSTPY